MGLKKTMDAEQIVNYLLKKNIGVILKKLWGEKGLLYNPNNKLVHGF